MPKEMLIDRSDMVKIGSVELQQRVTSKFSLLFSDEGKLLIRETPGVLGLLRRYRSDFEQRRNQRGEVRKKIADGREGTVFRAGDEIPLAVKEYHLPFFETHPDMSVEKQTTFLRNTLMRSEQLRLFSERYAPSYIRVPKYFGFLYLPLEGTDNARECFLFMERVNGQTMEAITANPATSDHLKDQLKKDWEQIKVLLDWDFPRTDPHFIEQPLVTDLFERNVLVDVASPTQERPYTLWIIDQ